MTKKIYYIRIDNENYIFPELVAENLGIKIDDLNYFLSSCKICCKWVKFTSLSIQRINYTLKKKYKLRFGVVLTRRLKFLMGWLPYIFVCIRMDDGFFDVEIDYNPIVIVEANKIKYISLLELCEYYCVDYEIIKEYIIKHKYLFDAKYLYELNLNFKSTIIRYSHKDFNITDKFLFIRERDKHSILNEVEELELI